MKRPPLPASGDNVMWVRFNAFGDVLQTLASAKIFKDRFPSTHITFVTRPLYKEIVLSQPYIDDAIVGEKGSIFEYYQLLKLIRAHSPFNWVISAEGQSKTDTIGLLTKIPNKVGTGCSICYDMPLFDWADSIGLDLRDREQPSIFANDNTQDITGLFDKLPPKSIFAIIGGAWKEKRWRTDYWCNFLEPLADEGWGVILNGHGEEELDSANCIMDNLNSPNVLNLVNKLTFFEMLNVSSRCSCAVGNDTGALHLTALQGIPTLGLFGGTRDDRICFLMPNFRAVQTTCPNVGCNDTKHCKVGINCLLSVTPERVRTVFDQMTKYM